MHFRTAGRISKPEVDMSRRWAISASGNRACTREARQSSMPAPGRDGQQPGRLVDDDNFGIGMDHRQAMVRRWQICTQNGVTRILQWLSRNAVVSRVHPDPGENCAQMRCSLEFPTHQYHGAGLAGACEVIIVKARPGNSFLSIVL
jgi:hypothetical protein